MKNKLFLMLGIIAFFAMSFADRINSPISSACSCFRSFNVEICNLGIIRICTGACGLISRKAIMLSSSYMISAGISPATILQNKQLSIGGPHIISSFNIDIVDRAAVSVLRRRTPKE